MPNELEIAREYGLSPGTVRKALEWMEEVRIVVRQQGRGTFVSGPSREDLRQRFDGVRTPEGSILALEFQVLESTVAPADAEAARHLGLQPEAPVYRLRRICAARGLPLMLEVITVSAQMFPSLTEPGAVYDLAAAASRNGVLIGLGRETLTLAAADATTAGLLKVPEGQTLLALERTIRCVDEQPAEWRRCWCNLDGYQYQVELR